MGGVSSGYRWFSLIGRSRVIGKGFELQAVCKSGRPCRKMQEACEGGGGALGGAPMMKSQGRIHDRRYNVVKGMCVRCRECRKRRNGLELCPGGRSEIERPIAEYVRGRKGK
jgi:hypothetical protein